MCVEGSQRNVLAQAIFLPFPLAPLLHKPTFFTRFICVIKCPRNNTYDKL